MHLSTPRQSKKDASLLCGLDDPHGSRREERLLRRRSCARVVSRCATAVSRQRFRTGVCVMAIYKEGRKKLGKSQRACQSVRVFWRALPFKMDNDTWSPDRLDVCVLRLVRCCPFPACLRMVSQILRVSGRSDSHNQHFSIFSIISQ